MRRLVPSSLLALALVAATGQALAGPTVPAPTPEQARATLAALPPSLGVRPPLVAIGPSLVLEDPPPANPRIGETVTVEGWAPRGAGQGLPYGGGWSPTGRREDVRVGPYGQPEWTTDRRWARVRSYVLPPWQVEVESWMRARYGRHDEGDRYLFQEEIGIGLPHRFQLDVYLNFQDDMEQSLHFKETQLELRWALADWDCLWLNPTLYAEYRIHDDPDESDAVEAKLLLSDDIAPRWVGGVNLVYERELSGEEEEVLGLTGAVSYSLIDQRLYVGAEAQWERATVEGARDEGEDTWYLGPSVSIRFNRRTHLDIAPLFGLNDASERLQLFVVLGVDIGPGSGEGGWLDPVAARSR